MDGLELSTDKRDLAAPDRGDLTTEPIFIRFRGPKALKGQELGTARVSLGAWKNDLTPRLFSQNNKNAASTPSDPTITPSTIPPRNK
jgi:hypothetical protein